MGALDGATAVRTVARRLAVLVRSLPEAGGPIVGAWSVAEVATHVTQVYEFDAGLAAGGEGALDHFSELACFTVDRVRRDPERNPEVLAQRIEAGAERFLAAMALSPPDGSTETNWLGGIRLPRPALYGHVLLESLIHGFDLARATGRPWTIDEPHAQLAMRELVFELLPRIGPTAMVSEQAADVQATFDLRVRGVGALRLAFDRGTLAVGPAGGRVDCHVSADAATLLLVSFKRIGLARPIARGHVLAWGRKPWLGLQLPSFLATP